MWQALHSPGCEAGEFCTTASKCLWDVWKPVMCCLPHFRFLCLTLPWTQVNWIVSGGCCSYRLRHRNIDPSQKAMAPEHFPFSAATSLPVMICEKQRFPPYFHHFFSSLMKLAILGKTEWVKVFMPRHDLSSLRKPKYEAYMQTRRTLYGSKHC